MYREDRSISEVHDEKVKALDDLLQRATGENVLIFTASDLIWTRYSRFVQMPLCWRMTRQQSSDGIAVKSRCWWLILRHARTA